MDLLQELFVMPGDFHATSLLPPGINLENLEHEEEILAHEMAVPLFGQETDHNMNSPQKFVTNYNQKESLEDYHQTTFLLPNESMVPRCKTPSNAIKSELPSTVQDLNEKLNPVTPTKPPETGDQDPWTPTANLKMLINAASPEIRNRERQQEMNKQFKDINDSDNSQDSILTMSVNPKSVPKTKGKVSKRTRAIKEETEHLVIDECMDVELETDGFNSHTSRKDKSLGLLCHRFLSKFPKYPEPFVNLHICLDAVAKELYVERRRIYDIVNVLESVEIVSRLAKNKYAWHGKTNLKHTLAKLKALAKLEGFTDQVEKIKDYEISRDLEVLGGQESDDTCTITCSSSHTPDTSNQTTACIKPTCVNYLRDSMKKDKSLGIMSQRFIMLFLISKPKTVNLDLAAKILIGDPNIDKTENAKFKTKIRRLYDIANILTSLDLITKVHVTEVRGRKPAFKYVGPDIEDVNNLSACSHDGAHRPSSRHSLLDCVQNPQVGSMLATNNSVKPGTSKQSFLKSQSSQPKSAEGPPPLTKKSFTRHSSFEQICEVAELERNRLYFESSRSQPTSPLKDPLKMSTPKLRPQPKVSAAKQLMISKYDQTSTIPDSPVTKSKPVIQKNLDNSHDSGNTVILKSVGSGSQVLTLSEKQLREILKNLGSKVTRTSTGVSILADSKYVDASTQSSPELVSGLLSLINQQNDVKTEGLVTKTVVKVPSPGQTPTRLKIIKFSNMGKTGEGQKVTVKRELEQTIPACDIAEKRIKLGKTDNNHYSAVCQTLPVPVMVQKYTQPHVDQTRPMQISNDAKVSLSIVHVPKVTMADPVIQVRSSGEPSNATISSICQQLPIQNVSSLPTYDIHHVTAPSTAELIEPQTVSHPTTTPSIRSLSHPNTPTFHLSGGSSPLMLLPTRPASIEAPPQLRDTPPTAIREPKLIIPVSKYVVSQSVARQHLPAFGTFVSPITAGTPTAQPGGTLLLNPSELSPLQAVGDSVMRNTSQHIFMPNTIVSPMTGLQVAQNHLFKPKGGFPPSSNTIINLMPLFGSPTSQNQNITSACPLAPVPLTMGSTFNMNSTLTSSSSQVICLPTATSGLTATQTISPNSASFTPKNITNPITVNGKPVTTPGCFFRSTPGGLQQVPTTGIVCGQNSAFQVVNRFTINNGEGPIPTARRLHLCQEDAVL